jgi:hypothetical protein
MPDIPDAALRADCAERHLTQLIHPIKYINYLDRLAYTIATSLRVVSPRLIKTEYWKCKNTHRLANWPSSFGNGK